MKDDDDWTLDDHHPLECLLLTLKMGYSKMVLSENKAFELFMEGSQLMHIVERGTKLVKELVLGYSTVNWLVQT